jgi:hypothetical protein
MEEIQAKSITQRALDVIEKIGNRFYSADCRAGAS